jgi:hypothetical protein
MGVELAIVFGGGNFVKATVDGVTAIQMHTFQVVIPKQVTGAVAAGTLTATASGSRSPGRTGRPQWVQSPAVATGSATAALTGHDSDLPTPLRSRRRGSACRPRSSASTSC